MGDGAVVAVGDLQIEALATPGHAAGHLSFVLRHAGRTSVFCGDAFFSAGASCCRTPGTARCRNSIRTVERLAALSVDGLFPGHLTFAVNEGRRHTEQAMEYVRRLLPPPQLT